jgi:hypothetical protein
MTTFSRYVTLLNRLEVEKYQLCGGEVKDALTGVKHSSGTSGLLCKADERLYFTAENIPEKDFAIIVEAIELLDRYGPGALRITHAECLARYLPYCAKLVEIFKIDCSIKNTKLRIISAAHYDYNYRGEPVTDLTTPIGWWLNELITAVDRGEFYFASYALAMVYTLACDRPPAVAPWQWYYRTSDDVRRDFNMIP